MESARKRFLCDVERLVERRGKEEVSQWLRAIHLWRSSADREGSSGAVFTRWMEQHHALLTMHAPPSPGPPPSVQLTDRTAHTPSRPRAAKVDTPTQTPVGLLPRVSVSPRHTCYTSSSSGGSTPRVRPPPNTPALESTPHGETTMTTTSSSFLTPATTPFRAPPNTPSYYRPGVGEQFEHRPPPNGFGSLRSVSPLYSPRRSPKRSRSTPPVRMATLSTILSKDDRPPHRPLPPLTLPRPTWRRSHTLPSRTSRSRSPSLSTRPSAVRETPPPQRSPMVPPSKSPSLPPHPDPKPTPSLPPSSSVSPPAKVWTSSPAWRTTPSPANTVHRRSHSVGVLTYRTEAQNRARLRASSVNCPRPVRGLRHLNILYTTEARWEDRFRALVEVEAGLHGVHDLSCLAKALAAQLSDRRPAVVRLALSIVEKVVMKYRDAFPLAKVLPSLLRLGATAGDVLHTVLHTTSPMGCLPHLVKHGRADMVEEVLERLVSRMNDVIHLEGGGRVVIPCGMPHDTALGLCRGAHRAGDPPTVERVEKGTLVADIAPLRTALLDLLSRTLPRTPTRLFWVVYLCFPEDAESMYATLPPAVQRRLHSCIPPLLPFTVPESLRPPPPASPPP
eukprot:Sspe_Gene.71479::Locus_42396_Transcript_1_1_Confidence_1.000_Length_1895::g.71479::m.71479